MVAMETGHFIKMLNDASLASLGLFMWKVLGCIICKNPLWVLSCKVNLFCCQTNCESLCLSDETLKAVGPFYLVSMPGEVKYPTRSWTPHSNLPSPREGQLSKNHS